METVTPGRKTLSLLIHLSTTMVSALRCQQLVLALALTFVLLHPAEGACRRSQEIECQTGGQCVSRSSLCNKQSDCPDSSDEDPTMCKLLPPESSNCDYDYSGSFYYSGNCYSLYDMCQITNRASSLDPRICEIVLRQPKLGRQQQGMNMSTDVVGLLSSAVNSTLNYKAPDCPMLYTRVGNDCLSFFSPAKVSWAEARHFCRSIYGDLWHSNDLATYALLLDYLREEQFTSDYWVGGRYDMDINAWSWATNDVAMPLGAPFWALKHEDSCVPRGPPHTDPYSAPPPALPGAPCYRTVLTPRKRTAGWCSAMTYEHFHYWSDETCDEAFSPLCTFTGPAASPHPDAH